jgi:hypothetical protein
MNSRDGLSELRANCTWEVARGCFRDAARGSPPSSGQSFHSLRDKFLWPRLTWIKEKPWTAWRRLTVGTGWLSPWVPQAAPITYLPSHAPSAVPAEREAEIDNPPGLRPPLPTFCREAPVSASHLEPYDRIIRNNVSDA